MAYRKTAQEKLDIISCLDKEYWARDFVIIGMDEAGRGPLAGPVVAAGVIMPSENLILGIDDSKKISENKRELLYEKIVENALEIGIGIVDNNVIDKLNILNAARLAFKKAYDKIKSSSDFVLTDYITNLDIKGYKAIKKGDSKSYSIAAASIVAKVTRDRIMREYDMIYPKYGFAKHKGYGTKQHMQAIEEFGATKIHRLSFIKNILYR
jgi:ribonuclease HII